MQAVDGGLQVLFLGREQLAACRCDSDRADLSVGCEHRSGRRRLWKRAVESETQTVEEGKMAERALRLWRPASLLAVHARRDIAKVLGGALKPCLGGGGDARMESAVREKRGEPDREDGDADERDREPCSQSQPAPHPQSLVRR